MNDEVSSPQSPIAPDAPQKTVSLALQGGGSHGAFTWGVMDALLEDGRLQLDGISGASAGAMNAAVLGHGFAQHPDDPAAARQAARAALADFWRKVARLGEASKLQRGWAQMWLSGWRASGASLSPYQFNPLDINPLRELLADCVDFKKLAKAASPLIHVCATHVKTGKAEIFSGKRLTEAAVMASACLPTLFRAVEVEGEHYWDGGFSGNPALHPLIYRCQASDIVLIQINPVERNAVPDNESEIMDRVNELTFNASLLAQMRAIDLVNRLIDKAYLPAERYRSIRMHRIDGGEALEAYPASTKSHADGQLIEALFELGKTCAQRWLKRHYDEVGIQSSINISKDYLDDMRMGHPADR
ncbi:patatin-like phospholipase family protein [Variovorax sp. PCZ-1]|uniref:patatin-like phospholipase family protein n=1 Tax=Variovorax sp. PCZ-1 TaxID=2835533 RepID=UPI001BCDB076|nr:patatin-like phospholipase family protein [Variovorax sp. PCZ-1]MBS7805983.1 patatin-like phospholipase family protein [Variovorax sp. PCZ-1]